MLDRFVAVDRRGERERPAYDVTPLSLLERTISFVAGQLERARGFAKIQIGDIDQAKFYTYREWEFINQYDRPRQREIKERLMRLDSERRQLALTHNRIISDHESRLHSLLNQRSLLTGH